jgi:hypothetical protein
MQGGPRASPHHGDGLIYQIRGDKTIMGKSPKISPFFPMFEEIERN